MHMTSEKYSVLKYGFRTKQSTNKWDKMSPAQRVRFEWMGTKYPTQQNLVFSSIACELDNIDVRYSSKDEIVVSTSKYIGRREALSYYLKADLKKYRNLGSCSFEHLVVRSINKEFCPELVILIDSVENQLEKILESKNMIWARKDVLKIMKLRSFINIQKYAELLS